MFPIPAQFKQIIFFLNVLRYVVHLHDVCYVDNCLSVLEDTPFPYLSGGASPYSPL